MPHFPACGPLGINLSQEVFANMRDDFYRDNNKYVRACNNRTEMYAGRVACCSLVSRIEYAPTGQTQTDRQMDGQTPNRYITLSANAVSVITQTRN